MRFVDRISQYPNNKKLTINSIEYSNGTISKLYVTEEKDEGTVTTVGTELNANNLNKAFEEFGRNRFLCIYLREMFGLIIDEDDFSFDLMGLNDDKPVEFNCELNMLYPHCVDNNLNVAVSTESDNGTIEFTPKPSLTQAIQKRVYVNFYTDSDHTNFVVRVPFLYTFTPSSTNPLD